MQYRAEREKIGSLDCVIVYPKSDLDKPLQPTALAVFCHGFGAGGDDLVGLANELLQTMASDQPVALAFPAAPLSLADQGMPGGRAWWMLSIQRLLSAIEDGRFEQVRAEVPEGIEDARNQLVEVIETLLQRYHLSPSKLLLGGFSQGAMLSVETACLGLKQPPAKLCLYSGALICEQRWKDEAARLKETEILQSHGSMDPVLPLQTGKWLQEMLDSSGATVKFIEFNGPHTIPHDAIVHTADMLGRLSKSD